jgi:hypothetical protein
MMEWDVRLSIGCREEDMENLLGLCMQREMLVVSYLVPDDVVLNDLNRSRSKATLQRKEARIGSAQIMKVYVVIGRIATYAENR